MITINTFLKQGLVAVLFTWGMAIVPAIAQTDQPQEQEPTLDLTELEILQACAEDRAATLPNPFPDVQPTDWAYGAVLTLYYCGAYRGAIPPQQYKDFLDSREEQQS